MKANQMSKNKFPGFMLQKIVANNKRMHEKKKIKSNNVHRIVIQKNKKTTKGVQQN